MFLISNYMQTTLKSSYMIEVETDRIRTMKDIVDRPNLIPMMHGDFPFILQVSLNYFSNDKKILH